MTILSIALPVSGFRIVHAAQKCVDLNRPMVYRIEKHSRHQLSVEECSRIWTVWQAIDTSWRARLINEFSKTPGTLLVACDTILSGNRARLQASQ